MVVLDPDRLRVPSLNRRDVKIETVRGSGPGGQHRNVTESTVKALHRPTGLTAVADGRSQHQNRQAALALLTERVAALERERHVEGRNQARRDQIEGERSMTWTDWRDEVVTRTGRRTSMSRALKGGLDPVL